MATKPSKTKNVAAAPQIAGPVLIDLDAVQAEVEFVIKLDGKEHPVKPVSLEDFIANTKIMQKAATGDEISMEQELELVLSVVDRSIPTIGMERLRKLTMIQLKALQDAAMQMNGTDEVKKEAAAEAAENPRKAA
jgi:hypothetical protein